MKFVLGLLFLVIISINLIAEERGGNPYYLVHIDFKRLSLNVNNDFDTIEITAYLKRKLNANASLPDTVNFNISLNHTVVAFDEKHRILITKPSHVHLGYIEPNGNFGHIYTFNFCNNNKNTDLVSGCNLTNHYFIKPNFEANLKANSWNQIQANLIYNGTTPATSGTYFYGFEMHHDMEDLDNHKIDHINWYKNGALMVNSDDVLNISESGSYYAEIVSNFGYSHFTDTITLSDIEFAFYSNCLDGIIAVKDEAKFDKIFSKK